MMSIERGFSTGNGRKTSFNWIMASTCQQPCSYNHVVIDSTCVQSISHCIVFLNEPLGL